MQDAAQDRDPLADLWIERGGCFEPSRRATGAAIDKAYTNNALVRTAALAGMESLFDERMALTGDEDVEFFHRSAGIPRSVRVDVCIATYCRPEGLLRLLGALQELRAPEVEAELRVVVVDNDARESARSVCEDARSWLSVPLVYAVEKRRGIPQARNAAAAIALRGADFLAFVDDDEVPDPGWMAELLRVQRAWEADAVAGPVLPLFAPGAPRWIERGGFFEPSRRETGTAIDRAYTGNVLVRTSALAGMERLFDERMALSGGEDVEFFRRFAASGRRIVWADAATVHEWVPRSRATLRWLLARSFRVGCSTVWIERHCVPRRRSTASLLARALEGTARGALALALSPLRGRLAAVRALRVVWNGAGSLCGLCGFVYQEYRALRGVRGRPAGARCRKASE